MLVRSVQSIKAYYSQDLVLQLQIGCLQASFHAQEEEKSQKILRETVSILRDILKKPTIEVMDILIRMFDSPKLSAKLLSPELFKTLVASLKSSLRNDNLCMKIVIVLCSDAALLALQPDDLQVLLESLQSRLSDSKELSSSYYLVISVLIEVLSDHGTYFLAILSILAFASAYLKQSSLISLFLTRASTSLSSTALLHVLQAILKISLTEGPIKGVESWLIDQSANDMQIVEEGLQLRMELICLVCHYSLHFLSEAEFGAVLFHYLNDKILEEEEGISLCEILTNCPFALSFFLEKEGRAWLRSSLRRHSANPRVVDFLRFIYCSALPGRGSDRRSFLENAALFEDVLYLFSLKTLKRRNEVFQLLYQAVCQVQVANANSDRLRFTTSSARDFIEGLKQMRLNEQQCIEAISLLSLCLRSFIAPSSSVEQLKATAPSTNLRSVVELIFALAAAQQSASVLSLLQSIVEDVSSLQAANCLSQEAVSQIGGAWLLRILKDCEETSIRIVCEMMETVCRSEEGVVFLLREGLEEILCERMEKASLEDSLIAMCSLLLWMCQYGKEF